jgi:hypothetical protein
MLAGVFFPGFPPTEGNSVHSIAMFAFVVGKDIDDLLSFADWRWE